MTEHYDVVIVGSGPGGGTMRCALRGPASAFFSWSVAIICRENAKTGTAKPYSSMPAIKPSRGAVNPTLTIIANALRVGDHIAERLGL